jgi:hypothetical protein
MLNTEKSPSLIRDQFFSKLWEDLDPGKVTYNIDGEWGTQILKMEIMNSESPNIDSLIDFLTTRFKDHTVMDLLLKGVGKSSGFHGGTGNNWEKNNEGNYECTVTFSGSFWNLDTNLLKDELFTGVDMDFYFDTRTKLGHTSYKWEEGNSCGDGKRLPNQKIMNVRYFISKDQVDLYHLEGHSTFHDFLENPEMFRDYDLEPRHFRTSTLSYSRIGDTYVPREKNNESLIHRPNYTPEEFDRSYLKLVELNSRIRPKINESLTLPKYHNCIREWVHQINLDKFFGLTRLENVNHDNEDCPYIDNLDTPYVR